MEPVWLVSDGRVLASAMRTTTRAERRRGLLGRDTIAEPLVLENCAWVHSLGMRTAIDVVHLDAHGTVLSATHLPRRRIGRPVRGAASVVEAAPGSVARWELKPGARVEVRRARN
jgi:uncharacterized membrane protein (UPF0127 family)